MAELIRYEVEGRIATLTLNRPEKLNAISAGMQREMLEALRDAERDPAVRVVVLKGEGRSFCAGYDVSGGTEGSGPRSSEGYSIATDRDRLEGFLRGWLAIWDLRIPVIAQVHGHCLAGGTQLAAICDVGFVAEDTRVGAPQLPLGAGFVAAFWAWYVGPKRAKELFFPVGSMISGREAAELGLFNRAVPAAELEATVAEYAARVAKTPKELLALQKQSINRTQEVQGFREALLQGTEVDAIAHFTDSVRETNRRIRETGLRAALADWQREGWG